MTFLPKTFARQLANIGFVMVRLAGAVCLAPMLGCEHTQSPFPPESEPRGAYLRITQAIAHDLPEDIFPYLEEDAQFACYTIVKLRRKALQKARETFPKAELAEVEVNLRELGEAPAMFATLARPRGWVARLRRDLSGVQAVEQDGNRATVVTARGSRISMSRQGNGTWGLTMFSAELMADATRAEKDLRRIEDTARDFERARVLKP